MKNALSTVTKLSNADWLKNSEWMLDLVKTPQPSFEKPLPLPFQSRLIRVDEINEEGHQAYRQALANVYGTLDAEQAVRFLYLLCGSASGVELYFGVVSDTENGDVHEAMKNLRGALEGQLTGINFGDDVSAENRDALFKAFSTASQQGVMLGAPTAQGQDDANEEDSFQGFDRLVRALQSSNSKDTQSEGRWKLAVVSQPLGRAHIRQQLDSAYELSSRLTTLVKTSVQSSDNTSRQKSTSIGSSEAKGTNESKGENWSKNKGGSEAHTEGTSSGSSSSSSNNSDTKTKTNGTSEGTSTNKGSSFTKTVSQNDSLSDTEGQSVGFTQEIANKRAQHLVDYLDKQLIVRLQKGLTKGLFHTAVYLAAEDRSTYQRLKKNVCATFQGSETTLRPLEIYDLPANAHGQFLRLPKITPQVSAQE